MLSLREEEGARLRLGGWRHRLAEIEVENWQVLREISDRVRYHLSPNATYILADAIEFVSTLPPDSLHAIVTDPPYGLEYEEKDHTKLRRGRGGVWRIPPTFDGASRRPLPRFTVLSDQDLTKLHSFFVEFGRGAHRALVPGGGARLHCVKPIAVLNDILFASERWLRETGRNHQARSDSPRRL